MRSESFNQGQVVAYLGDCFEVLPKLPALSIDMVMVDLPYGTTYASWDSVLPMGKLWAAYDAVVKKRGAHVFTASQPFTSALIGSRPDWFRCSWVWDKTFAANFFNAKIHPLKVHEDVIVFGSGKTTYNPQKVPGKRNEPHGTKHAGASATRLMVHQAGIPADLSGMKYPKSIQTFAKHASSVGLHPTQKPTALYEYFMKTYSNEGECVLDNCAGSGTAGEAALLTGRKAILIEKDEHYFNVTCERLSGSKPKPALVQGMLASFGRKHD